MPEAYTYTLQQGHISHGSPWDDIFYVFFFCPGAAETQFLFQVINMKNADFTQVCSTSKQMVG